MWLKRIEADRVRNLHTVQLDLPQGLTVLAGRNGQGKTSLLESIYLLATGRSFRTRRQDELVSWEGGPLRVAGEITSRRGSSDLTVVMHDGERGLLVDGQSTELEHYLGRIDLVDLTAPRMDVLRAGPAERRKFLDRGVVGLDPSFLRNLGEYRQVLQQRNALLRGPDARDRQTQEAQLAVWDDRLSVAAAELHRRRREYTVRLSGELGAVERALFPGGGQVHIRYRPSPAAAAELDAGDYAGAMCEALVRGRRRDRMLGHTATGPHRDELIVELDGKDLRKFGSAGQVRAAMIALKLAKLRLIHDLHGEPPLFLMDDFDTDIDEGRAAALAGFLEAGGFQAVVATSKETLASNLGVPFRRIRVDAGRATGTCT